ncbi:Methyltransferase domain-containing protein [Austwickia chelonae]|uniref:Methyltransferase domain-containing protein n=1 Tax=Austwickia chelonae NBRC 105200 TaxID=1184607 RepID=K6VV49_9MICO|nr:class I SAM-dependent methyltransferase [Austwickia chelonae]GAB79215.1 hypothetical protein AUCHE_21_00410 [Austwickia chelonae NBRC 105200]SEW37302.1 Methyltransferase domain-containing protein [Austwickia chelonae]
MSDRTGPAHPTTDTGTGTGITRSGENTRPGTAEKHMQGHWLLAHLGKKVLRPGGLGLTRQLLHAAAPTTTDHIVEFGPGVGKTATILLAAKPASYVAVDPNPQGQEALRKILDRHPRARLQISDAAHSELPDGCADLVVGEAMLSMQNEKEKDAIVSEAVRLLAPGGRYAVHELLREIPADTDPPTSGPGDPVSKEISRTIKVGARPLTVAGWHELLTRHGLEITWTGQAPMRLLEPSRIVADEGVLGASRFLINLARNKPARERVQAMRASFRAHADSLGAIAVVARKPR